MKDQTVDFLNHSMIHIIEEKLLEKVRLGGVLISISIKELRNATELKLWKIFF